MSTTSDYFECPQCGFPESWFHANTQFGRETYLCPICGYYHSAYLLIDRKNSTPGNWIWKLNAKGSAIQRRIEKPGYGIVSCLSHSGFGFVYRHAKPPTERQINQLIRRIQETPDVDLEVSYISRWDEATGKVVCVFGQLPETFLSSTDPTDDDK